MKKRILFYDTETSGFVRKDIPLHHPDQARIVQLGAILDQYDDETGEVRELMRMDVVIHVEKVPEKAAAIHGITTEISHEIGVNEGTAIDLFMDLTMVADIIVGHNHINFDNELIKAATRRCYNIEDYDPFANKELFDTMQVGKAICRIPSRGYGGYKPPKLIELHQYLFKEDFEAAHTAIADVSATQRCFYAMQKLLKAHQ